jgi:hypothetical protein
MVYWMDSPVIGVHRTRGDRRDQHDCRPFRGDAQGGVSAERFETPLVGGAARPGFPPEGETGKGGLFPPEPTAYLTRQCRAYPRRLTNSLRPLKTPNSPLPLFFRPPC